MKRREFLKQVGLLGATAAFGSAGWACAKSGPPTSAAASSRSRVALAIDKGVRRAQGLDGSRVAGLLDRTIAQAFDARTAREGLRRILGDGDVVGLKLNCLAGPPLSPTHELIDALVAALNKAGVPDEKIILFERAERDLKKGGFDIRRQGGLRVIGNDSPGAGYEEEITTSGRVGSCLSRVLTRQVSVLINVGVLKDHNLAGVSAGMKNLFGLIHNPNRYHDDACDPFVADVLAMPPVRQKLKLTVIDGLTAQCEGGPGYMPRFAWPANGLMASTDPVALDRMAQDLIEAQRRKLSLPSLAEQKRPPRWIQTAAARGLGVADPKRIALVREG